MDAQQAFSLFVRKHLVSARARRFGELCMSKKGQRKILLSLCHEFESAVRPGSVRRGGYDRFLGSPCYVFQGSLGFGAEFPSVREAYDRLSDTDSWLILLRDASAGIFRPEVKWDEEMLITG